MAGDSNRETWKYDPDSTHYDNQVTKLPENLKDGAEARQHIGRLSPNVQPQIKARMRSGTQPRVPDRIFKTAPPANLLGTPAEKERAGKFARATYNDTELATPQDRYNAFSPSNDRYSYVTPTGPINEHNYRHNGSLKEYTQGYNKDGDNTLIQTGDVTDEGTAEDVTGPVFYDNNTQHFQGNNPYRVTTDTVDKFVTDTARQMVGTTPGRVTRDPDTDEITGATPRSSEKRKDTQRTLSNLSRSLLTTYDNLNLDPTDFRNIHRGNGNPDDLNADDQAKYNDARGKYDDIAKNLNYLNLNDDSTKWSGTPMYHREGGISYQTGNGDNVLFKNDDNDDDFADNVQDLIMNQGTEGNSPFYFKPELSDYKIKVADKKSAIALSHTLRQFFDLQVLYYKKHIEILQVFQLLVIFFEKYNYSINSLMYILEHLVKDKIKPIEGEPTEGEPIEVAIPIDFTKSIIGMLKDQKQMMNVVAGFKAHLGMQDGGLQRQGNDVIMPDDNIFLDNTHGGVYATSVFRRGHDGPYENYGGPDATWYPTFSVDGQPLNEAISYILDGNGREFFSPEIIGMGPAPAPVPAVGPLPPPPGGVPPPPPIPPALGGGPAPAPAPVVDPPPALGGGPELAQVVAPRAPAFGMRGHDAVPLPSASAAASQSSRGFAPPQQPVPRWGDSRGANVVMQNFRPPQQAGYFSNEANLNTEIIRLMKRKLNNLPGYGNDATIFNGIKNGEYDNDSIIEQNYIEIRGQLIDKMTIEQAKALNIEINNIRYNRGGEFIFNTKPGISEDVYDKVTQILPS
jgi:hypothetical protein